MSAWQIVAFVALAKLVVHVSTSTRYGFHRDELYYITGGLNLSLGYVDHPPLVPLLAALAHALFGLSLPGLRLFSTLAGVTLVALAGLIARELGGGRFAIGLASFAALACPIYLLTNSLFQTVTFDQLIWVTGGWLVLRLLNTGDARYWPLLGLVFGIGLLTKYTIVIFVAGLALGFLLTCHRAWLRTRWPWLAVGIALLVASPNLWWQISNGWPSLEFIHNSSAREREERSFVTFPAVQLMMIGPLALPLVIAGVRGWFCQSLARYRPLAVAIAFAFILLMTLEAKPYYFAPAYVLILAAGAVMAEGAFAVASRAWMRSATVAMLTVNVLLLLPILIPILPAGTAARYNIFEMNDAFAESLGWNELAQTTAAAWHTLTPEQQERATIVAGSYGSAAAVDLYGARYGLPGAVSGHNSYYVWGPGTLRPEYLILVGFLPGQLELIDGTCTPAGTVTNRLNVENDEFNRPVYVCRDLHRALQDFWPELRDFQ
ncbi:MAG TPA: glycosyltransferase family 39 protein [Thermomicrobiales bacterium]|nr:glycosyltransferase family 39 protein [Thermomicrobiales bacterium]